MKDNARAIVAAAILVSGCGGDGRSGPDIVAQFTHYWVESDPNRPFSATFLGVPTWQNPLDLWSMNLEPAHLEDNFAAEQGEFRLEALPNGSTRLVGTTWYRQELWPAFYWQLWADEIVHRIHQRVLRHVKSLCEG